MRALAALLVLASAARAQDAVDFERDVLPILEARCFECHRSAHTDADGRLRKPKGGLSLDGKAGILRGSKDGPVVRPGDPQHSALYARTVLPPDDDDLMPNKGEPLTPAQTEVLRNWIAAGAPFGAWVGVGEESAAPAAPNTATLPAALVGFEPLAEGLAPASESALRKARGERAAIAPLWPDSPLLRVEFGGCEAEVTDADVAALAAVHEHVVHLDLARTRITDKALAAIARMPRLVHLDLRETAIGDAGLARLGELAGLRYLNLLGTKVGDRGLAALEALPALRAVYLWRSAVTEAGVEELRAKRPQIAVHLAPELPDAPPPPANPQQQRRR
jgi:hypothetical protein